MIYEIDKTQRFNNKRNRNRDMGDKYHINELAFSLPTFTYTTANNRTGLVINNKTLY